MPDIWMDVDIAIAEAPVNVMPLIDETDFKTIEAAVLYNAAGMALIWHFVTTAGVMTETAVTPTTAGLHDWTDQGTSGLYALEIPASTGTINNDTEGFGWFTGVVTGVLPWRGPTIGFRAAALNNALIDGGDLLDVNVTTISDTAQTANDNGADINAILIDTLPVGYLGSHGYGVYIGTAANTNTVDGVDGIFSNPVSTLTAAKTIADSIGVKTYYFTGGVDLTLAATHEDWNWIGLGSITDNIINLGSQDVDRSCFTNVMLEGTQGGTGRIMAVGCALRDPGAGVSTFHIFGVNCGIVDDITLDTSDNNVLIDSYSLVAGTGTPIIRGSGAAGTLIMNGHKGGVDLRDLSASHNLTINIAGGQCIFDVSNNVNANVSLRGIGTKTDNTAGMANLTETAFINMDKINAEADTAISDAALATAAALSTHDGKLDTAQLDLDTITGAAGALLDSTATSAQLVDDFYDEAESGHNVSGSFGKGFRQVKEGTVSQESTVNDAGATTTVFITALTEATDDHYRDVSLVFIDGALIGESRPIETYNGTTKTVTLGEALTEAPANGDGFIIKTDHVHTVTGIAAGVVTAMEVDGGDLSSIMEALVNKLIITEATGNTEMFNDADASQGTVTAAFTSDGTFTTRKRMVL